MTEEKDRNIEDFLIARFLMGECGDEELKALKERLDGDCDFAGRLFEAEQLFYLGKLDEEKEESHTQRAAHRLMTRIKNSRRGIVGLRGLRVAVRVAAMVAVVALMAVAGWEWKQRTGAPVEELMTITTTDAVKELKLPDGTTVILNSYTTLKYCRDNFAADRKVYVEGECHFEVTRDSEHPFVVHSKVMDVAVLGTVFDLKTDSLQGKASTTLLQGEVRVQGNRGEGMICLSPGQIAHVDANSRKLIVKQMEEVHEHWYSSTLNFRQSGLRSIATTLEHIYGVKVILSPELDLQKTYTGTVPKKATVEEVLDLMQNAMPIRYKVVGNSVFITK